MPTDERPARAGRPRRLPDAGSDLSSREQILEAAAALFVENGFAMTTTRAIAARVGIRQASLYYHFAGKDELLMDLLTNSVRPSLEVVRRIEALVPSAATAAGALYALALVDVDTLVRTPHNIGMLYMIPEVQGERYEGFHLERRKLESTYGRLGMAAATREVAVTMTAGRLGAVLIQLTELVIQLRRSGEPSAADRQGIASTCLRACGLSSVAIDAARREAEGLLERHLRPTAEPWAAITGSR